MSIVELRYGDVFEGASDLIVLPCSTAGTVTALVREKLSLYDIPFPKSGMKLGELDIIPFKGAANIARCVAFAASVTIPCISSPAAILQIGMLLGRETRRNHTIRRVAAPLLGAGAGGLQPELVISSLRDGFRLEAHEDSILTISIIERGLFELLCCHDLDLVTSVSTPESLATFESSAYETVPPASRHAAVEQVRQVTTPRTGRARGELGALRRAVKPPVPSPGPDRTSSPLPPSPPSTRHTILFLAANPVGTDRLALDEEARAIRVALERSRHRDRFQIEMRGAARPLDLLDELRKLKPTIVHFGGHGGTGGLFAQATGHRDIADNGATAGQRIDGPPVTGLFFRGRDGVAQLVSTAAIRQTFGAAGESVKLVVLNACYSDEQAEALLAHAGCVVGMRGSIRDDSATSFAIGFYGGLGESESVAAAYRQGCAAIGLEGLPDDDKPQLRVRDGVDAERIVLADPASGGVQARSRGLVPTPAYASAEVQVLSKRLEDARARKQMLHDAGLATEDVDREMLELRRKLREGGQLRAGDSLGDGRYLLVRVVGRGGFAVVWEAHDRIAQQRVAIKVLHASLAGDLQRRERFFRGAQAMRKLVHPAVVRVLEPEAVDGGFYYFVMEFAPGGNLREAVLAQRVKRDDRLPLILQVGEALAAAHARGMVHRDIKPANIVLDECGNAKLTDFDLVGACDTTGGTRTGALGTVVYAAPECLEKPQEATARADVFGLGMTAIFSLSGRDLSMDTFRNPEGTIAKLDCPEPVRSVLARAVMWDPGDRFASGAEMLATFRRAMRPDPPPEHAPWATATGSDRYGLWAVFDVRGICQRMRWLPAGTFFMGSPETELGRGDDEGPWHEVTLTRGYWLAETPVTQALWAAVMGKNPSQFRGALPEDLERPVECVSWDDCQQFLYSLNRQIDGLVARLPTEAEWERACRAGTTTATWVGDLSDKYHARELDSIAWYFANSRRETYAVGRKAPNPGGFHDMLGNVWEWCADQKRRYTSAPVTNPVGEDRGPSRVYRGGSWSTDARSVRAANRFARHCDTRSDNLGFRLAASQNSAPGRVPWNVR